MFSVIEVFMDYDYVEGVQHVQSFSTEEEAQQHIEKLKKQESDKFQKYKTYIEEYVDKIELPDLTGSNWFSIWDEFKKPYPCGFNSTPKDFHENLKSSLIINGYKINKDDFSPPPRMRNRELFVVEIP